MGILSWLGQAVINWVLNSLRELVQGILARIKRHKEIDKESEESTKPMEDAKTDKEQEDALKDSIGSGW